MSGPRPQRKLRKDFPRWALPGFAVLASLAGPAAGLSATTEQVVADWRSGIALGGVDPVAFFTDAAPKTGRTDVEYTYAGVTWRFRNEGNRAAFAADPEVYMPRFGGHDPVGVARGIARPGHPDLWLVAGNRLYLFYSAEARAAFMAEPQQVAEAADEKWSDVLRTLSR